MKFEVPLARPGKSGVAGAEASGEQVRRLALSVRGLSKTFVRSRVLADLDLTVEAGEVHALLGENGSGKSTFIKIIAGYHLPDPGGEVQIAGEELQFGSAESAKKLGCRFVHQDLGLVETESILTNMALGSGFPSSFGTIRIRRARREVAERLSVVGLDLDPEARIGDLSPAVRTGVAIARALRQGPGESAGKLLVLDEPTAALPDHEVDQLLDIVRATARQGVGVLYVTHRLDEVFEVAAVTTILRDGRKFAERDVESLTRGELVQLLVGREFEDVRNAAGRVHIKDVRPVLEVRNLGGSAVVDTSFSAMPGEILGIAGITGSGRESLLSLIFGASDRFAGSVRIDTVDIPALRPDESMHHGMAYLPADRKIRGGIMALSARENLTLSDLSTFWRPPLLNRRREEADAQDWFKRLDIRPAGAIEQVLSTFSGGNQQKIIMGKCLRAAPRVLLLDEPTQGVDVGAKADLYRQILAAAEDGAVVILSSPDPDELAALCHRVLVMRSGRIMAELTKEEVSTTRIIESVHSNGASATRAG